MYFAKDGTGFFGLEIFNEHGTNILRTVHKFVKNSSETYCYSFDIGQNEKLVGVKCGNFLDY